jgi:glycogen synthase
VPDQLAALPRCRIIRRSNVPIPGLRFGIDVVLTVARLWQARRTTDVVLAYQTVIDGLIAVLARSLTGVPVVVSVRSALEYDLTAVRQARLAAAFVLKRADLVAVQSARMREDLMSSIAARLTARERASLEQRLCILPNGVESDEAPSPDVSSAPIDVLFVGRLERVKGVHLLIEAMRQRPDQTLLIVGDGTERPALERAAAGLPHITFAGMVAPRDVSGYMTRAKVLVVPSLQEGQPNVALEAMPDVIRDGDTGLLVEPGDVTALGQAIHRVTTDPELRARLSGNCLTGMTPFQWPKVISTLEAILQRAAERGRARRVEAGAHE